MEPVSLVIGVASLAVPALQLYNRCKSNAADFHNLHEELEIFHQTLEFHEPHLPRLHPCRTASKRIIDEIEKLLADYESRSCWQRGKVALKDIQSIKTSLHFQISALHANSRSVIARQTCAEFFY